MKKVEQFTEKVRIVWHNQTPFHYINDIHVERLIDEEWIISESFNSLYDLNAGALARRCAMRLSSKEL